MWWNPKALLEVTIIQLGWDRKNWNNPYLVLWIPPRGRVERTCGVVAFFSLLTSLVVYKVWPKGTSIKVSEEGGLIIFSFNFPFPLGANFHLPPSTCVSIKLVKVCMKACSIFSLKGISRVGVLFFR
jgi:hypothetical protein